MTKQDTQKIQDALSLLEEAAREKTEDVSELIAGKYQQLKDVFYSLEDEASEKTRHGAERLSELKDAASERAQDTAARVDKKVHEAPWVTLGLPILGALAIGFMFGRKD